MTAKSAAELERDAEAARAEVVSTADFIRDKMSPGQLIDEFAGMFSGADGKGALSTLKNQVRDNPLAISLVGAGLVWLMVGQPASSAVATAWEAGKGDAKPSTAYRAGSDRGLSEGSVRDGLSTVADAAGSVSDAVAGAAGSAGAVARDAFGRLSDGASGAATVTNRARQGIEQVVQQEPLILAALGFAVGAAIGGLLPRSELEDQAVGELSGQVRGKADELLQAGLQAGKKIAAETFDTVKDEADKQGLTDTGASTLVEQVGKVAEAAASQVEKSIRDRSS